MAGAGRYAARHLQVLASFPNVDLAGLCNRGNSEIASLAGEYGVSQTFSDYRKMVEVVKPDAVFVVVSHFETVTVARHCLEGEVVDLAGRKESREEAGGDSFATVIRLSKGGLGVFTSHWLSVAGWSLTLYGVGAKAILSLATAGEVIFDSGQRLRVPVDPVDLKFKPGLFAQDEAFITALALKEKLTYPASDLADSARTMQLIEAIAQAA